jgi:hypothetical protein
MITGGSGALGKSLKNIFKDTFCPTHLEMILSEDKLKILKMGSNTFHGFKDIGLKWCIPQYILMDLLILNIVYP